ncbi:ABC transporter ATP-binding protein [Streptococcus sp. X16XC17]|nr:ABC transporter ATP-binding protein [Streptococcus sp. X16XC17]
MKQRLGIAMAIMGRPSLIVLDEPTNGLDPKAREEIRNLIRSLPERFQTTVMISSHALDEIEKMVTKIGIIGKGKLLYQGTIAEFKRQHSGHICLRTSEDERVSALLGVEAECIGGEMLLPMWSDQKVAGAIERLVRAGIAVYRVMEVTQSLEELFLDFTESDSL